VRGRSCRGRQHHDPAARHKVAPRRRRWSGQGSHHLRPGRRQCVVPHPRELEGVCFCRPGTGRRITRPVSRTQPVTRFPARVPDKENLPSGPGAPVPLVELQNLTTTMHSIKQHLPASIATERLVLTTPLLDRVPEMAVLANSRAIYEVLARLPHPYAESDGRFFV